MIYEPRPLPDITEEHRSLLKAVWKAFVAGKGWPTFAHIEAKIRQSGMDDPARTADELWPHYLTFNRRGGPPLNDDKIALTIRGLYATRFRNARDLAKAAAEAIGYLADRRAGYVPPADTGESLTVKDKEIRRAVGLGPEETRLLWYVFPSEPSLWHVGGSGVDDWRVQLDERLRPYEGVHDLKSFLKADLRRINSIAAGYQRPVYVDSGVVTMTGTASDVDVHERNLPIVVRDELDEALQSYRAGHPDQAVRAAMVALEERIRHATDAGPDVSGAALISAAFDEKNGLLWDDTIPFAEAKSIGQLYRGAFAVIRNPVMHRSMDHALADASEIIAMASFLMRRVDRDAQRIAARDAAR